MVAPSDGTAHRRLHLLRRRHAVADEAGTVAAILDHIARLWSIDANAEITLEANPGSVEAARFHGYRAAGVNRVSMGLQSLRDEELKKLGRIHSVGEAKAALDIARARSSAFPSTSFTPGQSRRQASGETNSLKLSTSPAITFRSIS